MAVIYTKKDYKFGIQAHDSDFDAVPASQAWTQLGVEEISILPTVTPVRPERSIGHRQLDNDDVDNYTKGAEHLVTIEPYDVVYQESARWIMEAMQTVDPEEDATTPFSKLMTPHSTQPDFEGDGGRQIHICAKHPAVSSSFVAMGCVVRELTLSISPDNLGRRLLLGATCVARDINMSFESEGAFSRNSQQYWTWDDIKANNGTCTLYNGTADTDLTLYGLEVTMNNNLVGVGADADGRPENYAMPRFEVSGTLRILREPTTEFVLADWEAGTVRKFICKWQTSGTFGATAGDLQIIIPMVIDTVEIDRSMEEIFVIGFTGCKTASFDSIKVNVADGKDYGW